MAEFATRTQLFNSNCQVGVRDKLHLKSPHTLYQKRDVQLLRTGLCPSFSFPKQIILSYPTPSLPSCPKIPFLRLAQILSSSLRKPVSHPTSNQYTQSPMGTCSTISLNAQVYATIYRVRNKALWFAWKLRIVCTAN